MLRLLASPDSSDYLSSLPPFEEGRQSPRACVGLHRSVYNPAPEPHARSSLAVFRTIPTAPPPPLETSRCPPGHFGPGDLSTVIGGSPPQEAVGLRLLECQTGPPAIDMRDDRGCPTRSRRAGCHATRRTIG